MKLLSLDEIKKYVGGYVFPHYTFDGWNTAANGSGDSYANESDMTDLDEDITLYAQWKPNKYTITFVNDDDTELQRGDVAYGETPEYTGEAPTKEATAQYKYKFAGWDKAIALVDG